MPRQGGDRYQPWKHRGVALGFVRSGIFWIDRTVHGRRFRVSTGCRTGDAALLEYQRFEADPSRFVPRGKVGTAWDDAVKAYLRYSEDVKLNGASHLAHQEYRLANLGAFTRGGSRVFASLEGFTKADILAFIAALTSGEITGRKVGAPSVNRHLSDLKALMRWAREEAHLTKNTADQDVAMVREERGIGAHAEVPARRWRAVAPLLLPRWRAALEVLLGAGLRPNELAALEEEDLLPHAIHVPRSKTRRGRTIPASSRCLAAAEQLLKLDSCPDDEGAQFKRRVEVAAKKAGVDPFTAYDLRHTYATCCLRAGAALRDVQEWMGHASIRTTEKYLHAARGGPRRASFAPV
jgi:integrase